MHNVFKNDPLELKQKINKKVQIQTKDDKIFDGSIYTIDPVSESLCLLGDDKSFSIIFPHAIKTLNIIEDVKEIPLIFGEKSEENLPINLNELKDKVKNWLLKHMIPVTVSGDILRIDDNLLITPPYNETNCISSNEITLSKIQSLIRKMSDCEL